MSGVRPASAANSATLSPDSFTLPAVMATTLDLGAHSKVKPSPPCCAPWGAGLAAAAPHVPRGLRPGPDRCTGPAENTGVTSSDRLLNGALNLALGLLAAGYGGWLLRRRVGLLREFDQPAT